MERRVIMRCVGFANDQPCPVAGLYLRSYDPEAYGGDGYVEFTRERRKARRMTMSEALILYRSSPQTRPLRPDGKPNRPLTATHWEFVPV